MALFSTRWWVCVIALTGFAVRLLFICTSHQYLVRHERTEVVSIARKLAERNEFADPYSIPTGPTAHSAPFGPFVNSLYIRAFGDTQSAEIAKELVSTAVASFLWGLLPWAAVQFGIDRRVGIGAGIFFGLIPLHPYLETKGEWEAVWTALAFLLLVVLFLRTWGRPGTAVPRGLAVGAVLYLQPTILPVILLWGLLEIASSPASARFRLFREGVVAVLILAGLQVPWAYRNYRALGAITWPRSNLGLELWLAYNDKSEVSLDESVQHGSFRLQHPNGSRLEAMAVRLKGEIRYNREKMAVAKQWIAAHPLKALALTAKRIRFFWFPTVRIGSRYVLLWIIPFLGWAGMLMLWRINSVAALLILICWLVFPLVNYVVLTSTRLAYPIFWSQALLSGVMIFNASSLYLRNRGRSAIVEAAVSTFR